MREGGRRVDSLEVDHGRRVGALQDPFDGYFKFLPGAGVGQGVDDDDVVGDVSGLTPWRMVRLTKVSGSCTGAVGTTNKGIQ